MANINFTCPHCLYTTQLASRTEGMKGNCPSCKAEVVITPNGKDSMVMVLTDFMLAQFQNGKSSKEILEVLLAKGVERKDAAMAVAMLIKGIQSTQVADDDNPDLAYVARTSYDDSTAGTRFSLLEPRISSLRNIRKYNLDDFEVELFADIEYEGLIHLEYLLYLFDKAGRRIAVVAANSVPGESALSMRLYNESEEINFGSEAMITNIDQFAAEAENIVRPILNGLE